MPAWPAPPSLRRCAGRSGSNPSRRRETPAGPAAPDPCPSGAQRWRADIHASARPRHRRRHGHRLGTGTARSSTHLPPKFVSERPASSHTAGSAVRSAARSRFTDSASRRSGCWTARAAVRRTAIVMMAPRCECPRLDGPPGGIVGTSGETFDRARKVEIPRSLGRHSSWQTIDEFTVTSHVNQQLARTFAVFHPSDFSPASDIAFAHALKIALPSKAISIDAHRTIALSSG